MRTGKREIDITDLVPTSSAGSPSTFGVFDAWTGGSVGVCRSWPDVVLGMNGLPHASTVFGEFEITGTLAEIMGSRLGFAFDTIAAAVAVSGWDGGAGAGSTQTLSVLLRKAAETDVVLIAPTQLPTVFGLDCLAPGPVSIPSAFSFGSVSLIVRIEFLGPTAGDSSTPFGYLFHLDLLFEGEFSVPNILNIIGNPIITDDGMSLLAESVISATKVWSSAVKPLKMHLYNLDVALTPQTVLTDLEESVFSGYGVVSLDALVAALTMDDVPVLEDGVLASFVGANPLTTPGQAAGYYLTDEDSTVLVAVERFEDIFPMNDIGDTINITPRLLLHGVLPS